MSESALGWAVDNQQGKLGSEARKAEVHQKDLSGERK